MPNRTNELDPESAGQLDPERGTSYVDFENLNVEEWREWLVSFLTGEPHAPLIAVEKEEQWHQFLIRVFDGLSAKGTVLFNQALFEVFEKTSACKNNERQLYTLLHVIAYSVPSDAKQFLRRRLREGIFRGLKYGLQDLHSMLLLTCSKYHVDEAMAKYVQRSARSSRDFDYLLLCQWVLSTVEGPQAFYFNERLLPLIDSAELGAAATRQLTSISERLGYADFLAWYQSRSIQLETTWGVRWEFFVESLRERLLSDHSLPMLAFKDRDAVLLYAELRIAQDIIPLATVLRIAQLHTTLGVEETSVILTDIWNDLFQRTGEAPWRYIASKDKAGARSSGSGTIFQSFGGSYSEKSVPVTDETSTETVLVEVRNSCESLIPKMSVAGAA